MLFFDYFLGKVTEVRKDSVIIDDLYQIFFDQLIIATGSRYPSVSTRNITSRVKKIQKNEELAGLKIFFWVHCEFHPNIDS